MSEKGNNVSNQFQLQSPLATEKFLTDIINKLTTIESEVNAITKQQYDLVRCNKCKQVRSRDRSKKKRESKPKNRRSRSGSPYSMLRPDYRSYEKRDYDKRRKSRQSSENNSNSSNSNSSNSNSSNSNSSNSNSSNSDSDSPDFSTATRESVSYSGPDAGLDECSYSDGYSYSE